MIAGIILAAGSSSRLGRPKQLLTLAGEPLIRHTVLHALESVLDRVLVVIDDDSGAIVKALEGLPVQLVPNSRAVEGQSTSVVAGIRALMDAEAEGPDQVEAVVMLLGDQPTIDPAVIDAVIQHWRESNAPIVAACYLDLMGSPVLFASTLFPDLLQIQGDTGARNILRAKRQSGEIASVLVDRYAPPDVDTEEDYRRLLETFKP